MQKSRAIQALDEIVEAISEVMLVFEEASSSSENVIEVKANQLQQLITGIKEEAIRKDEVVRSFSSEDQAITNRFNQCTQDLLNNSQKIQNIVARSLTVQRKDYDSLHGALKKILENLVAQFQLIDACNVKELFRLIKRKFSVMLRIKNLKNPKGVNAIREEMVVLDENWNHFLNDRISQTTDIEWGNVLTTARDEMERNFPSLFQMALTKIQSPTADNVERFDKILFGLLRNLSDILYIAQKTAEYIQSFGIMMDLPPLVDKGSVTFAPNPEVATSLGAMERAIKSNDPKATAEALRRFTVAAGKQVEQGRGLAEVQTDEESRRAILRGVQGLLGIQPEMAAATKRWAANPQDEDAKRKLLEEINMARQHNDAIENAKPQVAAMNAHSGLKSALAQLRNATSGQTLNKDQVTQQTKLVADQLKNQVAHARNAAQNIDDPILRKKINDAADELERLAPQIVSATKRVLENPNDQQARKDLNALLDKADRLNNTITEAILEDQLRKNGQDLEKAMQNLVAAVNGKDKDALEKALQRAEDLLRERISLARKYAAVTDDVMLKKELEESANKLEKQLEELRPKVMKAFLNPNDKRAQQEFKDLVEQINNNARRMDPSRAQEAASMTKTSKRVAEQGKSLEDAFDEFSRAMKRGDPKAAVQAAKTIAEGLHDQAALGRKLAEETDDPVLKKKILDAANRLDQLPSEIAAAMREVIKDPKNPEKLRKLEALIDEAKRHNKTITDAAKEIEKKKSQPPPPNPRPAKNQESEMFNGQPDKVMVAAHQVTNFVNKAATPVLPEEKTLLEISTDLGKEMEKLALYARQGNKTEMIATAKKIAGMISHIEKLTKEISNKCKNPLLKQQLLQVASAPQNFAVQLKIICAVKDRTSNDDKSASAQLVTCAQGLANSVTQTLSAAHAASLKCK